MGSRGIHHQSLRGELQPHSSSAYQLLCSADGVPRSAVGRLVTTVAYGEEMWKTMGEDLNAWNVETMHYINEAFFNFWPVDVFNFCTYPQCITDIHSLGLLIADSALYPYLDSWGLLQVRTALLDSPPMRQHLTAICLGKWAKERRFCQTRFAMNRLPKLSSSM
jgi:hypothetical protein